MSGEEWRPVPGWEGFYEVSSHGRVRSMKRQLRNASGFYMAKQKLRKCPIDNNGYPALTLRDKSKGKPVTARVHVLVAGAFIGSRPNGMQVCHIDGSRTNNRADNLRYGTQSENNHDRARHGRYKLKPHQVKRIRVLRQEGLTQQAIADRFGVSRKLISRIDLREVWAWL